MLLCNRNGNFFCSPQLQIHTLELHFRNFRHIFGHQAFFVIETQVETERFLTDRTTVTRTPG
jgi:hypothetical protein